MQIGTVIAVSKEKVIMQIGSIRIEFEIGGGHNIKEGDSVTIHLKR